MANDRAITEIAGTIACANDHGVKLVGGDAWVNVSRFAENVIIPPMGTRVTLGLDKTGRIREISSAAAAPVATQQPVQDAPQTAPVDRETRITRSASISAAIAALSSSGPVDVAEMFVLAGQIEAWVCR